MPFGNGDRWVEVAPAGAATTVAIVKPRPDEPTGIETRIALSTTDIDADHAELKARGVDVDDEVSRMGDPVPPMFFLRDQTVRRRDQLRDRTAGREPGDRSSRLAAAAPSPQARGVAAGSGDDARPVACSGRPIRRQPIIKIRSKT